MGAIPGCEEVSQRIFWRRRRALLGELDGIIDVSVGAGIELGDFRLGEDFFAKQHGTEAVQGVLAGPLFDLLARPVAAVVVRAGVGNQPVGLRFDEAGSVPLAAGTYR